MGKIYTYFLTMGGKTAEVICSTKAEAEKQYKKDSKMGSRRVSSKIILETTPYLVPVK